MARKFVPILKELKLSGSTLSDEFLQMKPRESEDEEPVKDHSRLIELVWSLLQIESVVMESFGGKKGVAVLDKKELQFLADVDIEKLSSKHFKMFK